MTAEGLGIALLSASVMAAAAQAPLQYLSFTDGNRVRISAELVSPCKLVFYAEGRQLRSFDDSNCDYDGLVIVSQRDSFIGVWMSHPDTDKGRLVVYQVTGDSANEVFRTEQPTELFDVDWDGRAELISFAVDANSVHAATAEVFHYDGKTFCSVGKVAWSDRAGASAMRAIRTHPTCPSKKVPTSSSHAR